MALEIGKKAPDFTLPSDSGKDVSLSDYLGKKVILYFYPKDNTSGCTLEAQAFRTHLADFENSATSSLASAATPSRSTATSGTRTNSTSRFSRMPMKSSSTFTASSRKRACTARNTWASKDPPSSSMKRKSRKRIPQSQSSLPRGGPLERPRREIRKAKRSWETDYRFPAPFIFQGRI